MQEHADRKEVEETEEYISADIRLPLLLFTLDAIV